MFLNDCGKKMNQKLQQKVPHANVNVNLTEENVIQIDSGMAIKC